jgi:hypothetical protein
MDVYAIVECKQAHCGNTTAILLGVLQGIKGDLVGSSKDDSFVDFVCPQCGFGSRRPIPSFRQEEPLTPPPNPIRYPRDLFHESLKCEKVGCTAHARVHTPGETSTSGTTPKIAASKWHGMTGITCSQGHPLKLHPEVL